MEKYVLKQKKNHQRNFTTKVPIKRMYIVIVQCTGTLRKKRRDFIFSFKQFIKKNYLHILIGYKDICNFDQPITNFPDFFG